MSQWTATKNIEHFKKLLAEEKDPDKRRVLQMLLAREEEKQRQDHAKGR